GGGSAMGSPEERRRFIEQVSKASRIAKSLRELGIRPYGIVRIDSATDVETWARDPEASKKIASTFNECCKIAKDNGERLAAEGEICWGGMHSWKRMLELLELVDQPETLGFQADMAHTLLYTLGYNAQEDAILPQGYDWKEQDTLQNALKRMTSALRPWTFDFHVAQNDATVKGSGSHDKTGRHCLPDDPNGKLSIARDAGYWLRNDKGELTKAFEHICWDGCMFPNETMLKQKTWDIILGAMVSVREAHGWQ
ncbi:MAG: sugar phosphate isomerase/epimerase, partial [Verrucomicrobia bacterium]|nr:sugar phosphate isomerase/epimerase [Verrucomicrobiota bacterium]